MDILTYLIALSLTILSVVKTTGLFYESDRKLGELQKNFIEKTRSLHQNEKGSITVVAMSLVLIISAMLYFYVSKMSIEYKEAVYRKDSYLCFKFLNEKSKGYINEMAKFNIALRTAFAAKSTVVNGISGEVAFKALTYSRNLRHFYYLKQIVSNKKCEGTDSLLYLKNLPFLTNETGALETYTDETTKVRNEQWTNTIYKKPVGIRLKKSFCLKTNFQIQGAFFPNLKMSSEEIPIEDMSSLKCFSGAPS